MNETIELVRLNVTAPKAPLPGLDEAQRKLLALQGTLDGINARLGGLSTHSAFKRTVATLRDTIQQIGKGSGLRDISKVLGFDPKDVREHFIREQERMNLALAESERKRSALRGKAHAKTRADMLAAEKQLQGEITALRRTFVGTQLKSTSAASAATFFHGYQQAAVKSAKEPIAMLQALFGKGGGAGPTPGLPATVAGAQLGGPISLVIPPSQIIATLGPGAVNVAIPAGQVAGHKASGGGGTGGAAAGGSAAAASPGGNVTQIRTEQPSGKTRTRTVAGHVSTDTFSAGNKQVITEDLKAKAREDLLRALERVRADYQKEIQKVLAKPPSTRQLSELVTAGKAAATQAAALTPGQFGALPARDVRKLTGGFGKDVVKDATKLADRMQADAVASFQRTAELRQALDAAQRAGDRAQQAALKKQLRAEQRRLQQLNRFYATGDRAQAAVDRVRQRTADFDEQQRRKTVLRQQAALYRQATTAAAQQAMTEFQTAGGKVVSQSAPYKGQPGKVVMEREEGGLKHTLTSTFGAAGAQATLTTRALKATREELGLLGGDFIKNTAKVAAWSASVAVLYKAVSLAADGLRALNEIGLQTARLDQVFTKIGGDTRELASDVLHLAAMYGRSSNETMEATIKWARVLKTRSAINEAVRVSLMAANVAELSVGESTDHLTAIMQAYNLEVGSLRTVLGELNQISNTYNVTNAAMLEGISRTASLAKSAGLPLQELMGLIGAAVGATAQTGANFGNAIKSLTTALGNPVLQEKLREQFRFEVAAEGGDDLKGLSQVLAELYVRYEKLNEAQRQSLVFQVAGKTQSSRLAALLDNYVRAQVLAINAQLNLNSATEENEKIVGSLKAQLIGLNTEWERFVVTQGNNGPAQALEEIAKALRNVLSLMNSPAGGTLTTLFAGLAAGAAAKVALTAMTAKGGMAQGFMSRSLDRVVGAGISLNNATNAAAVGFLQRRNPPVPYSTVAGRTWGLGRGPGRPNLTATAGLLPTLAQLGWLDRFILKTNVWGEAALRVARNANVASGAVRGLFGAFGVGMKAVSLATMALSEFFLPLAVIAGGVYAFNKGMEALGLSSEAAESRLAGFNQEAERAAAAANAFSQSANLFKTMANAFRTEKGFQGMRPEDQIKLIKQASEVAGLYEPDLAQRGKLQTQFRNELLALQAQGRFAEIVNRAEAERNRLIGQRREQLQLEFEAIKRRERENARELDRLRARDAGRFGFVGRDKRQQQIAEFEKRQQEAAAEKTRNLMDQSSAFDDQVQSSERFKTAMEKQQLLSDSIGEIFNLIPASSPLERAMVKLAALEAQRYANRLRLTELTREDERNLVGQAERRQAVAAIDQRILETRDAIGKLDVADAQNAEFGLGKFYKELGSAALTGSGPTLDRFKQIKQERARLMGDLERLESERTAAEGGRLPGMDLSFAQSQEQQNKLREENQRLAREAAAVAASRRAAEAQTRFQSGQRQTGFLSAANNFGTDSTDKLLRQHETLARDADALERKQNLTLEERGRLFEDLHRRQQALLDLKQRQVDVEAEIKQLALDQQREFAKSLLGSGPSELLRKLAAFRLTFDNKGQRRPGMDFGGFFALSPGLREDYAQLNPQFDPKRAELENERRRLGETIGKIDLDGALNQLSEKIGRWALELSKPAAEFANTLTSMKDAASGAVAKLNELTGAAQTFVNFVGSLQFAGLAGRATLPFNPQSGGLGAGAGRTR